MLAKYRDAGRTAQWPTWQTIWFALLAEDASGIDLQHAENSGESFKVAPALNFDKVQRVESAHNQPAVA